MTADAPKTGRSTGPSPADAIRLRVLASSDLHMQLGQDDGGGGLPGAGLARLAPRIRKERDRHPNLLLFDNGDLIEGSPLAEEIALAGDVASPHPAIAALNLLRYDAATLGNHDFTFGTEYLSEVLARAEYPVVLANAGLRAGAQPWGESVILRRVFTDRGGDCHAVAVGVFGVFPPQTPQWETTLGTRLITESVLPAARRAVSRLRAQGADLIVALSHGGPGAPPDDTPPPPMTENAARAIAAIDGVDVVVAGHTHEVLADPPEATRAAVVCPGAGGSHLGAFTVDLIPEGQGWRAQCRTAETLPAEPEPCPDILAVGAPSRRRASASLSTPLTTIAGRITSHYALLGRDPGLRLIAAALRLVAARAIEETPLEPLPVLCALAPFRTGGRAGPEHFLDLPPGPFLRGDLSRLYPFSNTLVGLKLSGAEVRDWIERACGIYRQIHPDEGPQPLIDPEFPGFWFDVLDGVTAEVELSAAPKYDFRGRPTGAPGRVERLRIGDRALDPEDSVIVLTNSYRVSAGPLYAPLCADRACCLPHNARMRIRDLLAWHLTSKPQHEIDPRPFLTLRLPPGAQLFFQTAVNADPDLAPLRVASSEITTNGFRRMLLTAHAAARKVTAA